MHIVSSQPSKADKAQHERGGRVTLVGAGPGDPDLLTIKALRALQSADVILFDDLVSDAVLDLARKEARRMMVGKRGGQRSCRQDDINEMMIVLAQAGHHVVRLKSGDPMVFGRGGEEIAALKAQGIQVSIVPGITSALAMASTFGVSLTHRDHAHTVRFVTAHNRNGVLPEDVDWHALAHEKTTTVFYMGGRMAADLARRLLAEGASGRTPVVIASALTRDNEKLVVCSLSDIANNLVAIDLTEPVLIGIGDVFGDACAEFSNMFASVSAQVDEELQVVGRGQ